MEARLSQLSKGELENNTKKELVEATNQVCIILNSYIYVFESLNSIILNQ